MGGSASAGRTGAPPPFFTHLTPECEENAPAVRALIERHASSGSDRGE